MVSVVVKKSAVIILIDLDDEPDKTPETLTYEIHVKVEVKEQDKTYRISDGSDNTGTGDNSFKTSANKHTLLKLSDKKYIVITVDGNVLMCTNTNAMVKIKGSKPFDFATSKKQFVTNISDMGKLSSDGLWKEITLNVMIGKEDDNLRTQKNASVSIANEDITFIYNESEEIAELSILKAGLNGSLEESTHNKNFLNDCEETTEQITLDKQQTKSSVINRKNLNCRVCGKVFRHTATLSLPKLLSNYIQHLRLHKNVKPFKCTKCSNTFVSYERLLNHQNVVHEKIKQYLCSLCSKTFGTSCSLAQHVRRHTADKKHKCSECDKRFISKPELILHLNYHQTVRSFLCELCGKSYRSNHDLKFHITRRHPDGLVKPCGNCLQMSCKCLTNLRTKLCEICNKKISSHKMSDHIKFRHSKLFFCKYCSKGFQSIGERKKHVIAEHGDLRQFGCDECGRKFLNSTNLYTHKLSHGDKQFSCEICGKKFPDNSSLRAHAVVHTGMRVYSCKRCGTKVPVSTGSRSERRSCENCNGDLKLERCLKTIYETLDM